MSWNWLAFRYKYRLGYGFGLLAGLAVLLLLLSAEHADWHSAGPANIGHQKLQCSDCHRAADGNARQQIQANLKQLLGLREHGAYFRFKPVGNDHCLDCHQRPDDRHPVQRFNEPRFLEVRQKLHPEHCVSCHSEHQAVRVTLADSGFCRHCHEEFSLKHDPINVSHQTLVKQQRWSSCLGCHDFHGNHKMESPVRLDRAIAPDKISAYFKGADSPYPGQIMHKAKEKLHEP